jgi:hypothetical protein
MSPCTTLDPRIVTALHWCAQHWELLVIVGMFGIIVALWQHGR